MSRPEVGDMVKYFAGAHQSSNGTRMHPAVITQTFDGEYYNIKVFPAFGEPFDVGSVRLGNPGGYFEAK